MAKTTTFMGLTAEQLIAGSAGLRAIAQPLTGLLHNRSIYGQAANRKATARLGMRYDREQHSREFAAALGQINNRLAGEGGSSIDAFYAQLAADAAEDERTIVHNRLAELREIDEAARAQERSLAVDLIAGLNTLVQAYGSIQELRNTTSEQAYIGGQYRTQTSRSEQRTGAVTQE
jgi:hypothetical protein